MTRWTNHDRALWRNRYEDGETYEAIALDVGSSTGTVRKGVLHAGGASRGPGQRRATKKKRVKGASDWLPTVPGSRRGHRRRGRPSRRY